MLIYIRIHGYEASVEAKSLNTVTCESCHTPFAYILERQAQSFAVNPGLALQNARAGIPAALRDIDPIYCPTCGHMQAAMVRKRKRLHLQSLRNTALLLTFLGSIGPFITWSILRDPHPLDNFFETFLVAALATAAFITGISLLLYRTLSTLRLNPNSLPLPDRLSLAQQSCLTKSQLQNLQSP